MSEKRKNCLLLAAVILLVAGLAVTGILLPDQQISLTERRSLAQLPTVSVSLVLDKSFSEAFDSYRISSPSGNGSAGCGPGRTGWCSACGMTTVFI